jgi:molybdopterin converting factor small subunit
MITIELFGVPRQRAGKARLEVQAHTLGEALRALSRACPALEASVLANGAMHPAYRVSLNGDRFVSDPATILGEGDALLLLAADAGG